ncbi:acyl-CoA dehydrogenase family protein [Nocardia asteroides]|uniref:acyl-CoA dehydrogenase family protein n=1 Tax=Nocardia asteroides TaxID=1824 RepID=UPI001E457832|nr:acyl-CoA dehydrogenase family protein [Nocardia asteroides]UGT61237.1 acyl-CoA/acyl-ACP dehydrogenase [Nocardia asteroides]
MSAFAEFHDELRSVARELLGKVGDGPVPWEVVSQAGWPGLAVPEEFDGAGAGVAEVAVLLTEVGRAAARTALPSVLALSVPALLAVGGDALRDEVLRAVVQGRRVPVVVLGSDPPAPGSASGRPEFAGVRLEDAGSGGGGAARRPEAPLSGPEAALSGPEAAFRLEGGRVTGAAHLVLDAPTAELLLIPARDADGDMVLAAVDPDAVTCTPVPLVDATRTVGSITADGAEPRAVWRFETPIALGARAALATACDALGIAQAMLDATVAYVRVREQFGRPVGSFQAVKHACADMLVRVTVAGHLVAEAVRALESSAPGAEISAGMAKSYATEAAVAVAGSAMQLHGGYGYTWESGIHTYLKRATLDRALYGTPAAHRRTLAARYRG